MSEPETVVRPLTCADVRALADDYLSGGLDPEAVVSFETHLVTCDDCFTAYFVTTVDDL